MSETATSIHIAGAGLVGLSLALALKSRGIAVTLSERGPDPATTNGPDERHLALAERSAQFLASLGLKRFFEEHGEVIARIHVSSAGEFGVTRLVAHDQGLKRFGVVVPARKLLLALRDAAAQPGIELRFGDGVTSAEDSETDIAATTATGSRIHSRLLVIADGAESSLRSASGIDAEVFDYEQDAVVAAIDTERAANGEAFERLLRNGLVALLPQRGTRAGVVFVQPRERASELMALGDDDYLSELQTTFGYRLGRLRRIGPRVRWPLRRVMAQALIAPRRVVIGNAAQSVHPIGAQGLNLGLRDVADLVDSLGHDPGDADALARYALQRMPDRLGVCRQTHLLALGTQLRSPLAALARSAALAAADRLLPLRDHLTLRGMGWGGAAV